MAVPLFAALYWLLLVAGPSPWQLATGLLFLALWQAPRRCWPWILLAAFLARWASDAVPGLGGAGAAKVPGHLLGPLLVAGPVAWLRRTHAAPAALAELEGSIRFLLSALLTAALLAGLSMPLPEAGRVEQAVLGAAQALLGHFVGCLLLVPMGAWLGMRRTQADAGAILGEVLLLAPLALVLLGLIVVARDSAPLVELLRLAMLAGVAVFAVRHGWRGAWLSLLAVMALMAVEDRLGLADGVSASLQWSVALVGALALIAGVAADGYRRQAGELDAAKRRLSSLAEELHEAAMRNLTVEERERQRLAGELHDEFGQNLAALQTHLTLSLPAMEAAGRAGVVERLLELTRQMQHNIGRVLDSLRPAALDELGLFGAIDRGSLRRLAEDSGLVFETRLEGDARLLTRLSPIHRVAAFRMAQGAVTNVVRHANARNCWLRLRASERGGQLWLFMDVRDDGEGRLEAIKPGNGLSGLQDRVINLGGRLVISQRRPGLRVHAMIRQPLVR